jgi:hypothetical protein
VSTPSQASNRPSITLHQYVEECCNDWAADQETDVSPDEVFWDMASSIIEGGLWRDMGYTPAEVRAFCKANGMSFGMTVR